jgi:outer membrane receptor for ferrienterochelin and colicin
MKQRLHALLFTLILFVSTCATILGQGVTTASIVGKVEEANGGPLPGAQVVATHQATGTTYGTVADEKGNFRLPNLQIGGPYKVAISFVGFQTYSKEGINLRLGEQYPLQIKLQEEAVQLAEINVTAQGSFDRNRTGPATTVSREQLESLPTIERSLTDYMRLTPQATLVQGEGTGISFAGMNNRYNAIYIDGAINNDVFGLAYSGTNGGQAGISPISIDALEQIQVVTSPYDVTKGGFVGAGINAVTRSGKNYFEGSAYFLNRNEKLAGVTPSTGDKLAPFTSNIYGVRLGGPIVKDKLFFFTNIELQKDETPLPFSFNTYAGNADVTKINQLVDVLQQTYGYNPGGYLNELNSLKGTKVLGKLDWNINKTHKLSLRHSYVKGVAETRNRPNSTTLYFGNTGVYFPSVTNSSAVELRSSFSPSLSNHLILGLTTVRDDRDILGQPFPQVQAGDGDATIIFGTDNFSYTNIVNQDVITLTNNLTFYKNNHTLTIGTHNEFFKLLNTFTIFSTPRYIYGGPTGLESFLSGAPGFYLFGHELPVSQGQAIRLADNAENVAADFSAMQLGFYVQDEIVVSDRFKISPGLRIDIPVNLEDAPQINTSFNQTTIPLIESFGYDLQGARASVLPKSRIHWSPRIGFNWDVSNTNSVQLRGGIGIFTSRIPWVWPGGIYIRNGLTSSLSLGVQPFYPNPGQWQTNLATNLTKPSGDVDIYAENFKYPQVFRGSLGADIQLLGGFVGSAEFMYTKNISNIRVQNVNVKPSTAALTGTPDNRPIFNTEDKIDPTYNNITLVTNTSQGYTWNATATLSYPVRKGFGGSIAYSFTRAKSLYDGEQFINNDNWVYREQVNGRNNAVLATSLYDAGHRIVAAIGYQKEYLGFMATKVSLVFTGQTGSPFSYVYNDDGLLNNEIFSPGIQ